MRSPSLLLLAATLAACGEPDARNKPPGEDFQRDHTVRITSPGNGDTLPPAFAIRWEAGREVSELRLEADGAPLEAVTDLGDGEGRLALELSEGRHDLRLVGLDADGAELSEHGITVRVTATGEEPWVTITSPSDGALVTNPVGFAVNAPEGVDEIELLADDWSLGTVAPGGVLSYTFEGTGYARTIEAVAYDEGEAVATDVITITVDPGEDPAPSSFNDLVLSYAGTYPTDGSYAYWWPSDTEWGGNPHDIYYLGELFSAGDPERRSFCVGLTFEVFMRAFDEVDQSWGGDGSLNGIAFDELYEFRTDWYVRDLYGTGIVEAMETYGIGDRVYSWDAVQPGDIIQFWRHSGSGHNAVFMDWEVDGEGGIVGFTYWSTQGSTDGIGTNAEYFGASGSRVDPNFFFVGRVRTPDQWEPWL